MLKITRLKNSNVKILKPILLQYEYKPYRQYFTKSDDSKLNRYFLKKVDSLLSNKGTQNLVVKENSEIAGILSWSESLWDSQQLGIKMARINQLIVRKDIHNTYIIKKLLTSVTKRCKHRSIKYLFHRVEVDDLLTFQILEKAGFQLQDVIINFCFNLRTSRIPLFKSKFVIIRPYRSKDLRCLQEIARTSFIYDRFHSDPQLNKKRSDQLHAAWISNACQGLADIVLVAELNKRVVGFVSCKVDKLSERYLPFSFGTIDLIAVDRDVQGRGVGKALMRKALDWFSDKVDIIEVGTQVRNYPALRLYQKLGFKIVSANFSLRKWFS